MTSESNLEQAKAQIRARSWRTAAEAYAAADAVAPLGLDDLELAGLAMHLSGSDDAAAALWTRAHHEALESGDPLRAVRAAFQLGMMLSQRGDMAVAGGWLARAARLVEESGRDCVERGYLIVPEALGTIDAGEPAHAFELFAQAGAIADRFGDPNLATLARLGQGRSLIDQGEVGRGLVLLDEALVAVTADEVSPTIAGVTYCASIEGFVAAFDLRRAQQWSAALDRWCAAQPDLVPFRGRCLVYRTELMRLHGAWSAAIDEARRAKEWLSRPPPEPAVGEAHYQEAELHRLRGEFEAADAAYREAGRWGRRPEPGLALLRLAQGRLGVAVSIIRRAVGEAHTDVARAVLLDPLAEIALAAGDVAAARAAVDDLAAIARRHSMPLLDATAARAEGVVRLAEGDAGRALPELRLAAAAWQSLEIPYEHARVRVSIGLVLRELGDTDSADIELDAAGRAFLELGAGPDLERLETLRGAASVRPGGLSPREVEVLRLLAAGLTNRAIAGDLVISERTVDRHVSNIYAKLGVATRAAATAYAYEHGIVAG